MKNKLLALSFVLLLSNNAGATVPPKPEKCPDAIAIQGVGIENNGKDTGLGWGFIKKNNYDTQDNWGLIVHVDYQSPIPLDKDTAFAKATQALQTLSFSEGPILARDKKAWFCVYKTNDKGVHATAFTPIPHSDIVSMIRFN